MHFNSLGGGDLLADIATGFSVVTPETYAFVTLGTR